MCNTCTPFFTIVRFSNKFNSFSAQMTIHRIYIFNTKLK